MRNRIAFTDGMRDAVPVGLGYFAVSFSLGIAAGNAGLSAFQGFLASLLTNASAGEYAGFTVIASGAPYIEMALVILIANARYLLMSCALSQRMSPGTPWYHRICMGFDITDELFAIAISRPGYLNPFYTYGAVLVAAPCWAIGTALGVAAGNSMPLRAVSALSVALYGMFLAVIVPPCRRSKAVAGTVAVCFALSFAASVVPCLSAFSEGTKTIVLTILISSGAALLCPVNVQNQTEKQEGGENES